MHCGTFIQYPVEIVGNQFDISGLIWQLNSGALIVMLLGVYEKNTARVCPGANWPRVKYFITRMLYTQFWHIVILCFLGGCFYQK